jgi:hypothetical protein
VQIYQATSPAAGGQKLISVAARATSVALTRPTAEIVQHCN